MNTPQAGSKKTIRRNAGGRVEASFVEGGVVLCDSRDPDGPKLFFTPSEWTAFVGGVHLGEFELAPLAKAATRSMVHGQPRQ